MTSTPEATWTNPFPTPVTNKTTYLAGFQYKDNRLEFFPHAEGYVKYQYSENSYSYVFNYTDHLGNIRVSYSDIDGNGTLGNEYIQECPRQIGSTPPPCQDLYVSAILEESHYYPFGLKHEGYNSNNQQPNYNYKYNGKELQTELGLNMYDMDMRDYDPAIARWVVQDPITHHSMSPYVAFDNNPVFFADPSGADSEMPSWMQDAWNNSGSGTTHWVNNGNGEFEKAEQNKKVNVVVWFGNDGQSINKGYENDAHSLDKSVITISNISNLNDLKRELSKIVGNNKINNLIIMSHGSVGQIILGSDGLLPNDSENQPYKQYNDNIEKLQNILEPYLQNSNVCFTACNVAHSNKGDEGKGYEFISMFQGISKKTKSTFYFNAAAGKANINRFKNDDSKNLSQNNVIFPNSQKSQKWRAVQGGSISYKYSLYFTNRGNIKFSPLVKRW